MSWGAVEAEILAALGPGGGAVPLHRLVAAVDHYTHSVPTGEQFAQAMDLIVGSGLAEVVGTSIRLTDRGSAIWRSSHPEGSDLPPWILGKLNDDVPARMGRSGVAASQWDTAVAWYALPLRERVIRKLGYRRGEAR